MGERVCLRFSIAHLCVLGMLSWGTRPLEAVAICYPMMVRYSVIHRVIR